MQDPLVEILAKTLERNISSSSWNWLQQKAEGIKGKSSLIYAAFASVPRFVEKKTIELDETAQQEIALSGKGFTLTGSSCDKAARIFLLLNLPTDNKDEFIKTVDELFKSGEMNELAVLYAALPVLPFPEEWRFRCTEGIRSNIGTVLEAIMYENPYPFKYLNEAAWNQMILKAFFTDKQVERIIGLDERANEKLANTLIDYVHERRAAGRKINHQIWRLISGFIDEANFNDIKKLLIDGDIRDKEAAALSISKSTFQPARELLEDYPDLKIKLETNKLNWESFLANEEEKV